MKTLSFPKEKIRILLLEGIHPIAVERLAERGYTNVERLTHALSGEELHERLAKVHMVGIRSRSKMTAAALAAGTRLLAVGCFCIGTSQVDLDAAAELGIPVFNAPHANTRSVAELVLAECVMLVRGLGDKNTGAHQGRWLKSAAGSHELRGKTLGIVGYGHIGTQVSILAEAFGLRVLFHDVVPKLPHGNAQQVSTLEELLPQVDLLTLHVPLDPSTHRLMDAERLALMKPGAHLINASRGTVVDVEALAAAIQSEHLGGAAVDVFPVEPSSKDEPFQSPLQGLRNVVLTPHIGGSTAEAQYNIGLDVSARLADYSDQGTTTGAVNFPEISLPAQADAHRLLHVHRNQPGMLSGINAAIAATQANVVGQYLQTRGDVGYVVMDVDGGSSPQLRDKLQEIPGTVRVRLLY